MYKYNIPKFTRNLTSVRMYDNGIDVPVFKIVLQNSGRNSIVDYEKVTASYGLNEKKNEEKLANNISRSKSKILDYGYSNHWDYFITQTMDGKKYDRTNLKVFIKDFMQVIRNIRRNYNCDFNYLIVPELHKDKESWHIHGLISSVNPILFKAFDRRKKLPKYIKEHKDVLDFPYLSKKFGFTTVQPIKDSNRSVTYVSKYVTKKVSSCVSEFNAHIYYCSQGLNTSSVIAKGVPSVNLPFTFTNDYCSILWHYDGNIDYIQDIINILEND